jgi:hypothetical protein
MKVTIEVDCTPLEARQFMGLPDVQPIQAAAMAELEKRILTEMERVSPEGLLRNWFVEGPQNAEKLWKSLTNVLTGAIRPNPDPPK